MPEVIKRIGPMRLVFDVVQCGDEVHVLLHYIGWQGTNVILNRPMIHEQRTRRDELEEFDYYQDKYGPKMLDAAREAIEAERLDLAREDAERYAN